MCRKLFILLACILPLIAVASSTTVDLDNPIVLQGLKHSSPDRYKVIERILHETPAQPPEALDKWIRTSFNATRVSSMSIMTSDPPKIRLSFAIGGTQYVATVTLVVGDDRNVPVDHGFR